MNINPKDHISCSARDMRAWRDEKPVLEKELSQLEMELQPSLLQSMGSI